MSDMVAKLRTYRIMPVAAVESPEAGLKLCEALLAGGLGSIEFTFRTRAAAPAIAAAHRAFPEMFVGAGTVLNTTDLQAAIDAGASFAVAPGCNPTVVAEAVRQGLAFFPGVATPSDWDRAIDLGCTCLKFFPAEAMGGVKLLKAIGAPYKHLGLGYIPTGGINAANMGAYLDLPETVAVGGSWMVKSDLVQAGDWARITELTAEAVALTRS